MARITNARETHFYLQGICSTINASFSFVLVVLVGVSNISFSILILVTVLF